MAIHSNTKAPKEINLMMVPLLQAAINGHIMQLIIKRRLKIFHILLLPSIFPTFSYPCTKPPTAPAIVPTPISQRAASAAIGGETCANAMLAPMPTIIDIVAYVLLTRKGLDLLTHLQTFLMFNPF